MDATTECDSKTYMDAPTKTGDSKIYTKAGDMGYTTTGASSARVEKCSLEIQAIGAIDELNAAMGALRRLDTAQVPAHGPSQALVDFLNPLAVVGIVDIQTALFNIGGIVAAANYEDIPSLNKLTGQLETCIDSATAALPPLRNFIYPQAETADIHMARVICRRAERALAELAMRMKCSQSVLRFMNRLSDYIFILARVYGPPDKKWTPTRAEALIIRGKRRVHYTDQAEKEETVRARAGGLNRSVCCEPRHWYDQCSGLLLAAIVSSTLIVYSMYAGR